MEAALYDPQFGYYNRSDLKRQGKDADYRTSAERSELFAATFARYFVKLYEELGRPAEWTIVEAGARDGSFATRGFRRLQEGYPSVFEPTRYVFDERSPDAVDRARAALAAFQERGTCGGLSAITSGVYFSNELLEDRKSTRLNS